MTDRRVHAIVLGWVLATAAAFATAEPVAAECMGFDRWPSFTVAARSAPTIVIGEVVESYDEDSADNTIQFRVRVDEQLRGKTPSMLDFRGGTRSGAPLTICPDNSILRVHVGDVLAVALGTQVTAAPESVIAVAWVEGKPRLFFMPGSETLTLARVRELVALPATDTLPVSVERAPVNLPVGPILVAIFVFVVLVARPQWTRT